MSTRTTGRDESQIRQNFSPEAERALNDVINLGWRVIYQYAAITYEFKRDTKALYGFGALFKCRKMRVALGVRQLIRYLSVRGGDVEFNDVTHPEKVDFDTGLEALQFCLDLEKKVNSALLQLVDVADKQNDHHLMEYVRSNIMTEQVLTIKRFADLITVLTRAGATELAEYEIDKDLRKFFGLIAPIMPSIVPTGAVTTGGITTADLGGITKDWASLQQQIAQQHISPDMNLLNFWQRFLIGSFGFL
jgi:ferritin